METLTAATFANRRHDAVQARGINLDAFSFNIYYSVLIVIFIILYIIICIHYFVQYEVYE